ncbi:MAG: LuxR family transcriptional regulator [Piscirickettsiaceae bacterium]|nr:MAG: LuxR family transcriptional regulator [Piscirickettsiaceae bacterium]
MYFLDKYQEHLYALLRIVSGFLFTWHGTQKFFNYPVNFPHPSLNMLMSAAGGIELLGGGLIMLGLFTRPAAFISSGTMAVAYWMVHSSKALLPMTNGGETAVLFCFVFLFIAARGAGIWSFDKK